MRKEKGMYAMWLIKALLASYIVTGILLFILTLLVYTFEFGEQIVLGSIVTIYVASTFIGGLIIGKLMKVKKFMWGLLLGMLYFLLLVLVSYGVYREFDTNGLHVVTTIILCFGGGTLGGMIA